MSNNYGYDEDLSEFVMEEYKRAKKSYEKKDSRYKKAQERYEDTCQNSDNYFNKVLRLVARRRLESAEIKRKIARDKYKKAIKNKKYNDVIEYKKKALELKRDIIDAYSNKSNYSLYDIIDYLYNQLFELFELSGSVSYFDIKMQLLKFKDGECTIDQIYDSIIESCMAQKTSEIVHEFISGDEEK